MAFVIAPFGVYVKRKNTPNDVFCGDISHMLFWEEVKKRIAQQNTNQEWVAGKAGVSYRTLSGWILKDRMPKADLAVEIARVLGTSVESLVTGLEPPLAMASAIAGRPRLRSLVESLMPRSDEEIIRAAQLIDIGILGNLPETKGPPTKNRATG